MEDNATCFGAMFALALLVPGVFIVHDKNVSIVRFANSK